MIQRVTCASVKSRTSDHLYKESQDVSVPNWISDQDI